MPDFRSYFDSDWIKAWDLDGKPRTVFIERVERGSAYDQKSRGNKAMPVIWFRGAKKPFGCNKTNCKTLANLYGRDTKDWIGKTIEVYPTTTSVGGESDVPCIRMRAPKGVAAPLPERLPEPEKKAEDNSGALGPEIQCESGRCGVCEFCVSANKAVEEAE